MLIKISRLLGLLFAITACQSSPQENISKQDDTSSSSAQKTEAREMASPPRASIGDVEKGIRAYIKEKVKEGNGYFELKNDSMDHRLRLVRVHTEYLSVLGPERYFACVDLADTTGDVYDVDFFLNGDPGAMEVTQTTMHKLNGKPFYTWQQGEDKTWHRVPVKNASRPLLGVIEGEDQFEFFYELRLPNLEAAVEMWVPIAGSTKFQDVEITELKAPGSYQYVEDKAEGNRMLHLSLKPEHSGDSLGISYRVTRKEKAPYAGQKPFDNQYLSAAPLLPVGGRFDSIAREVLKEKRYENTLVKARALYDYVIESVRYAKQGKYGTGDANYACDSRSGNCTEFHSLFISLARSSGIPARFAIGAAIPSERDEGGVNGYHCWAEFYAQGKWWPIDISEANKYSALATYYFGHHPANRIELSRGRNLRPEPMPHSGAIPFLAYPVLEVAQKKVAVATSFSFRRM